MNDETRGSAEFISACANGDIDTVDIILANDEGYYMLNDEGVEGAVCAAINGHADVVRRLALVNISVLDVRRFVYYVLSFCLCKNKEKTLKRGLAILLENGANIQYMLSDDSSPDPGLVHLLCNGQFGVAKWMVAQGMDISGDVHDILYDLDDIASTVHCTDIIKIIDELVMLGLNVGGKNGCGSWLLDVAKKCDDISVLRHALVIGATDVPDYEGNFNRTLCDMGDEDIEQVTLLVEAGADFAADPLGTSSLVSGALYSESPAVLRELLDHGASPYTSPDPDDDPFDYANAECERIILSRRAELDRAQIIDVSIGLRELDLPVLVVTEICAAASRCRPDARINLEKEWSILKTIKQFT